MTVRTRFSPSPTGMIHIGNARAALFSALYAKKNHGNFILRIEDTDAARSEKEYITSLQEDLHWLNIDWQEGPGVGGDFGPYWQSERQDIYAKYYKILEEKKLTYPCFCTDQELLLARKIQLSRGQPPRYSGTCKKLSQVEIDKRIAEGKKPAWRFSVPLNTTIEFEDSVKGMQQFKSDDIGDFIIRRADGTSPFLFCNAIDDALMKVTHVLRGEDHLANTPRQILLLQALELPVAHYGHLSLIVGEDGAPLSKRHGSFSVHDIKENGYLPIAIINYLARLGHVCDVQNLLSFDELAKHFYLEKLSRSPARFDLSQLMFWQQTAVQALDALAFWRWVGGEVKKNVPEEVQSLFADTIKMNIEFPKDAAMWAKVFFQNDMTIDAEALAVIHETGEQFFVVAEQAVDQYGADYPQIVAMLKQNLNIGGKKLFMPLRVALTGKMHGPELINVVQLLGQSKLKQRLGQALKLVHLNKGA